MRPFACGLSVLALGLLTGCGDIFGNRDAKEPGTALGAFLVSATVASNTCGSGALGVPQGPWEFGVELSREPGALYWDNGAQIVVGELGQDGVTFAFDAKVVVDMRTEERPGPTPCTVERGDTAHGVLDNAGEPVRGFSGTMTFSFSPTADSMCSDLVSGTATDEPLFAALPCAMVFSLDARQSGER